MNKKSKNDAKKLPGFYIALCCCVLAIGIAGYFSEKFMESDTDAESVFSDLAPETTAEVSNTFAPSSAYSARIMTTAAPGATAEPEPAIDENAEPENDVDSYAKENPDVESAAVIVSGEEPYFSMPAGGKILAGFTDTLSYNEATGDYRTHNGIDIAADEGCSISAAAGGNIEDISADAMGSNITISHSNGMQSKYMCLGSVESLSIGDTVKAGDVIGTVGTPKCENTTEAHLHFELYENGELIDPLKYLN